MTDEREPCTHHRLTERCHICNPLTEESTMPDEKPDKKMTRAEAQAALQVYTSQEIEAHTLGLLEEFIVDLGNFPTDEITIMVGGEFNDHCDQRNQIVRHVQGLELGRVTAPTWLSRFRKLIDEIRDEFDLRVEDVATPLGEGDAAP